MLGEQVAIVGPNGAGKSTLLKLIGALLTAHQGQVRVLGLSIGPVGVAAGRPGAAERRVLRRATGLRLQGLHLVPLLATRVIGMAAGRVQWDRPIGEVTAPMRRDLYDRRAGQSRSSPEPGPAAMARLAGA